MYQYIGIDISKATLDVYDGKKSIKVSNSATGFKKLLKLVPKEKRACFIFEPTGIYAHALMEFCQHNSIEALIVGSKEARDYARSIKQRSKTDKIDAEVLYRYASQINHEKGIVPKIPILDSWMRRLNQRRNLYEHYQMMIQQFKNLLESTYSGDRALCRELKREIVSFTQKAEKLHKEIEALLCEKEENETHLEHLQTIPGVGKKSAVTFLLELCRYPDATVKEMTALMGLDPVLRESGIFKGKTRISKKGGKRFRQALFLPTIIAIRHNDRIKIFYERLISRGKPKKVAILAAMRKLLIIAMALVRYKTPYQAAAEKQAII
ncbi:MAG: IS110 family transposase [Sulfurospirillum sp.]|nr:MAG: IS110 family transposase [Sulfurospirillum sp.]